MTQLIDKKESRSLKGHFLIAMPNMADERFKKAVVYICSHSPEGAMGIVINQLAQGFRFSDLLSQLNISPGLEAITFSGRLKGIDVYRGGPVETSRGFVLHSPDYFIARTTQSVGSKICLTATLDILKAVAEGGGPQDLLFALGYAGWTAGQLEQEIESNGWLSCEAIPEVIFRAAAHERYDEVLKIIGIEPKDIALLSLTAGHA